MSQELFDLIGLIYDAALEPARWDVALDALRTQLGFHNGMMTVINTATSASVVAAKSNVPPQYAPMSGPEYVPHILQLWGGASALAAHIIEEPVVMSDYSGPKQWAGNRYYEEFARPQGIIDAVNVALLRQPQLVGDLAFGRHESQGPIAPAVVERLKTLAPHLRRASLIGGMLTNGTAALAEAEAALEVSPAGIVLVDGEMNIRHANGVAADMLRRRDPIRQVGDRLELSHELLLGQLAQAVDLAGRDPVHIGRKGIGVPARRADGTPLVVHVVPLMAARRISPKIKAVAAIFIADSDGPPRGIDDILGLLFDLTPTEARVFQLAVSGNDPRQIAGLMHIAASTQKTHMLNIFRKTGRHSQAALVRLAAELQLDG